MSRSEPRTLVRLCIGGYQGWGEGARKAYGRLVKRVCAERGWGVDALLSADSDGGLDGITAYWAGELRKPHVEIAKSRHHRDAELRQVDNLAALCDAAIVLISESDGAGRNLIGALRRHNRPYTIAHVESGEIEHVHAR